MCNFHIIDTLLGILIASAIVNAQVEIEFGAIPPDTLVMCYPISRTCMGMTPMVDFQVTTIEECCDNRIEVITGLSYVTDSVEGCLVCPVVFGFGQPTLVGRERAEEYSVEFGFFSGFALNTKILNFDLNLETASSSDVILQTQNLTFLSEQPLLTSVRFSFPVDGVAQEDDETFTISYSDISPSAAFSIGTLTVMDAFSATIEDADRVKIRLSENFYREDESLPVQVVVEKNQALANPITFTITPLNISAADSLLDGTLIEAELPADNPFSPNRADNQDFDTTVLTVTFPADELEPAPITSISVPINITDDDINEAEEQLFVVHLTIVEANDLSLIDNEDRNVSIGSIIDNDPIFIGFEFQSYQFLEPEVLTNILELSDDGVFLIKQDDQLTEQTFDITIVASDSSSLLPATLQGQDADFDYSLGGAGISEITVRFLPDDFRIPFNFSLNGDDIVEGLEAFVVMELPTPGFPLFDMLFNSSVFSEAEIQILDDDVAVIGFLEVSVNVSEDAGQAILEIGIISGILQRDVSLELVLINGSASVGSDYEEFPDDILTLGPNVTSLEVAVVLINDEIREEFAETLQAILQFPGGETAGNVDVTIEPSVADITIFDDEVTTIGFISQSVSAMENDGQAILTIGILSGSLLMDISVQISLIDGSAVVGSDYEALSDEVFTLGPTMLTSEVAVTLVNDNITEQTESLQASMSLVEEQANVVIDPSVTNITIFDDDEEAIINDTTIGDPFFTVPISLPEDQLQALHVKVLSLCYELHGEMDKWFNLITDTCTSVNGLFSYLSQSLNVISEIAVRTVDNYNECVNIRVNVHQCTAQVNGAYLFPGERYSRGGVTVQRKDGRVRISVPNCRDITLVMWAVCEIDLPGQPGEMLKFMVSRGLNYGVKKAHGLFGQFWNSPVSISPFDGRYTDGSPVSNRYLVNITTTNHTRRLVGFVSNVNWAGEEQWCLYVGDRQGGATISIAGYQNDGVVEGTYRNYEVSGPYTERDYMYSLFDENKCLT